MTQMEMPGAVRIAGLKPRILDHASLKEQKSHPIPYRMLYPNPHVPEE
jgi:hypothetical protein